MFHGFDQQQIDLGEVVINLRKGGEGLPLLLLHGYPQTHVMWHKVAPRLAEDFTVIVPDLRGYGDSSKPPAGENHAGYSKRQMAQDMVGVMQALGFQQWFVAGHDRGARVSYRMALDHPDKVLRLCSMDVVPTVEQFEQIAHRPTAVAMYHWFFLAQPSPFPEKLIGEDPAYYLRHSMESWGGGNSVFEPEAMAEYIRCFSDPETIRATCDCYRAGATIDCDIDVQTRENGDQITCPTLILWGDRGGAWSGKAQMKIWQRWATDVRGQGVPNGHFCPEEAPDETYEAMKAFFS